MRAYIVRVVLAAVVTVLPTAGWTLAHKTGTSVTWRGVTAPTYDVGVLTAPDGTLISVVVFIADSKAPSEQRAALMAMSHGRS